VLEKALQQRRHGRRPASTVADSALGTACSASTRDVLIAISACRHSVWNCLASIRGNFPNCRSSIMTAHSDLDSRGGLLQGGRIRYCPSPSMWMKPVALGFAARWRTPRTGWPGARCCAGSHAGNHRRSTGDAGSLSRPSAAFSHSNINVLINGDRVPAGTRSTRPDRHSPRARKSLYCLNMARSQGSDGIELFVTRKAPLPALRATRGRFGAGRRGHGLCL